MEGIPLVSIFCPTYNHEKYISRCIEGFLMQKTTFPIEVFVQDDASIDKTPEIIKEYAEKYDFIIAVFHSENQYSQGKNLNEYFYRNLKGKYIALCEGDDYWTDSYKLQKQVDFLEKNPEYGLTFTNARFFFEERNRFKGKSNINFHDFKSMLLGGGAITLTACFRRDSIITYLGEVQPDKRGWKMGDLPIWLWIAMTYKIKVFKEVTGVYRIHSKSASEHNAKNERIAIVKSALEIQEYFITNFNKPEFKDKVKILYYNRLKAIAVRFKDKDLLRDSILYCHQNGPGYQIFDRMKLFFLDSRIILSGLLKLEEILKTATFFFIYITSPLFRKS